MNLRYCYDVNGQAQRFVYDLKGQLTAVLDDQNKPVEAYRYDPAGNILEKTLDGQTTRYVYDKANQLVSSTVDGQETLYRYDAAGRLVQEGSKTYVYGYQDKILSVKENGKVAATFDYYLNGQLASVTRGSETETFYWDGLALVARGQTRYLNEPHVGGGAPVLASGKTLFNDLLGNTLGVQEGETYTPVKMTAFGETKTKEAFFTGKPFIGELGYAFLLRNYRPNHGKWQTADPLGYPDGWNSFAYCNNSVLDGVDWLGAWRFRLTGEKGPLPGRFTFGNFTTDVRVIGPDGTVTVLPAYYNGYAVLDLSHSVSGDLTDTLTMTCRASATFRDTSSNTTISLTFNFKITYVLDDDGNYTSFVSGPMWTENGNANTYAGMYGSGGGENTFSVYGLFSSYTGAFPNQTLFGFVDGFSFEVIE